MPSINSRLKRLSNVGLRPTPRLGRLRGPDAPRRSLAGALCAPPLCGNENRILVRSRITVYIVVCTLVFDSELTAQEQLS